MESCKHKSGGFPSNVSEIYLIFISCALSICIFGIVYSCTDIYTDIHCKLDQESCISCIESATKLQYYAQYREKENNLLTTTIRNDRIRKQADPTKSEHCCKT